MRLAPRGRAAARRCARWSVPLLAATQLACTPLPSPEALHGAWQGRIGAETVRLELDPDGACRLMLPTGQSDAWLSGNCEMNVAKRPIPLSMRGIAELSHPLHTIVELAGPDELHLAPFATRWRLRPVAFGSQRIVLHRVPQDARELGEG